MQTISCPNCGGGVSFRSAASVMAVCEYCQSTLLKDADSVKNIGKMSELLEDYSPLQITTSGIFKGRSYAIVGRIQLRYEAGIWNEWHILFDDGSSGWLSDASGQYVLTVPDNPPDTAPEFDNIRPGSPLGYRGTVFTASDVRTAHCIAGEGELPFRVGNGWTAKTADYRSGHRFLTLDYSDGALPQWYAGQAVTLEQMRCQLLRSNESVINEAGRFRGQATALDCPSCGAPIRYVAGMICHIVCPACHAEVDCSADKALVLKKADELARIVTTIALGESATINGAKYETIGMMQCGTSDGGESWTWFEYFLFSAGKGFLWLVESNGRWDSISVLDQWPDRSTDGTFRLAGNAYAKAEEYDATVLYAAGAFNWRVSAGDRTHVIEFKNGDRMLSAESNASEIVWSSGRQVPTALIGQWFGKQIGTPATDREDRAGTETMIKTAKIVTLLLAGLNVPLSFASGMIGLKIVLAALCILWLPVLIVRYFGREHDA